MARCKCRNAARIVSDVVQNICQTNNCANGGMNYGCTDVCVNPVMGTPNVLGIYAPVIYDEVGINLCTTFDLGIDLVTEYPTVSWASVRIADIAFTYGEGNVEVEPITGRPNCYLITLSNLTVTFAVSLYDAACRLVTTVYPTAVYLPSDVAAPTYDDDTNPSIVELELFAPYGSAFTLDGTVLTPTINVIGFETTNNFVRQGINMYALPKLINLDTDDSTVTVGITLILQSLYFAGYCVETSGRINTPKGNLSTSEGSDCMEFVEGNLLELAIRPLNLCGNDNSSCGCENTSYGRETASCGCDSVSCGSAQNGAVMLANEYRMEND